MDYRGWGKKPIKRHHLLREIRRRLSAELALGLFGVSRAIRRQTRPLFFGANEFRFSNDGSWAVLNSFMSTVRPSAWEHLRYLTLRAPPPPADFRGNKPILLVEHEVQHLLRLRNTVSMNPHANFASVCVLAQFRMPSLRKLNLLIHVEWSLWSDKLYVETNLEPLTQLMAARPQVSVTAVILGYESQTWSARQPRFRIGGRLLTIASWGISDHFSWTPPKAAPAKLLRQLFRLGVEKVVMAEVAIDGYNIDKAFDITKLFDKDKGCLKATEEVRD